MHPDSIIKKPLGTCKDYTGYQYNFVTIRAYAGRRPGKSGTTVWKCECGLCGTYFFSRIDLIQRPRNKSCGCYNGTQHRTHGKSKTSEFGIWQNIKDRCRSGSHITATHYANRGIKICQRWSDSFEVFLADVGERPSLEYSIDRINNDGHYSCGKCDECAEKGWPLNVRWATDTEQNRNNRNNKHITHNGETLCYSEWSERLGGTKCLVSLRLRNGWYPEDAVSLPLGSKPSRRLPAIASA